MSIAKAIARAWSDPDFKKKLVSDPRAALAEAGIRVPEGTTLKVMENTADTQYLVLPVAPADSASVSLNDLENVAIGTQPTYTLGCPTGNC